MDSVLEGIKEIQSILDDAKESIEGGLHLRLCTATLAAYERAEAVKGAEEGQSDEEAPEMPLLSDAEEEEESEYEEPMERREEDMEPHELAELWGWQFDFGRPSAVLQLEALICSIVENAEGKRVCAAVQVLNNALSGCKPEDPADAEKILKWKEKLVAGRAIRVCAEILEGVDQRGFESKSHKEHWLHGILCDEILELFQRLGENDARFRTKLLRNGALKGVQAYDKEHPHWRRAQDVLDMLQQR